MASVLILGGLVLAGCSGSSDSKPAAQAAAVTQAGSSVVIAETDTGFEPKTVSVARGQVIMLTFVNKGKVIHNLHIAGADGRFGTEDDTVLGQPVVNPGESATIEWTAPAQAMQLEYRCDLHPEHRGLISVR